MGQAPGGQQRRCSANGAAVDIRLPHARRRSTMAPIISKEASLVYGNDDAREAAALPLSFKALRQRYAQTAEFYLAEKGAAGQARSQGMRIRSESDYQLIRESDVIIVRDTKKHAPDADREQTTYKAEYASVRPSRHNQKVRDDAGDMPVCPTSFRTMHQNDFRPFRVTNGPQYAAAPIIGPNPNKTGGTTYTDEFVEPPRSFEQPSVYDDDVEVPAPYEAPYVSAYSRAFAKPGKQPLRGAFREPYPTKPSGASAFTSTYRGEFLPVAGVQAPRAPIVQAREDVPQWQAFHSSSREIGRVPAARAKCVFMEPEGPLQ